MEETFNPYAPTMMPENKEIRAAAKATLSGRWLNPVLCTLLFMVITCVASALQGDPNHPSAILSTLCAAVALLVVGPLSFGYEVAFLRHVRGEDDDDLVTRPFEAFKQYGRYLGTSVLMIVFTFLWSLLLIVPGIIKGISYAMAPFIMHDHPELSPRECLRRSQQMMDGYKWKFFLLCLGFIGWLLLCILTLGILTLWIEPWMTCSYAKFYEELKARQSATQEQSW